MLIRPSLVKSSLGGVAAQSRVKRPQSGVRIWAKGIHLSPYFALILLAASWASSQVAGCLEKPTALSGSQYHWSATLPTLPGMEYTFPLYLIASLIVEMTPSRSFVASGSVEALISPSSGWITWASTHCAVDHGTSITE